jgi:hypothetical protein
MTECCFKNLGCLQIPTSEVSVAGQTGATGTITIGTVTTGAAGSSVTITNVGTPTAAILNFSIPQGNAGVAGADGTTRLFELLESTTIGTTGSWQNLITFNLPANTLDAVGDSIMIKATSTQDSPVVGFNLPTRRITFDGNTCTILDGFEAIQLDESDADVSYRTEVELNYSSATTALCRVFYDISLDGQRITNFFTKELTSLDFTQSNSILFDVFQYTASEVNLTSLTIDLIKS